MLFLAFLSAFFMPLNSLGAKMNRSDGNARVLSIGILTGLSGVIAWLVALIAKNRVTSDMFLYAVLFAVIFVATTVMGLKAYTCGPLVGTALFSNASLIIVVLFSTFYFHEPFGLLRGVGVAGVCIALVLLTLPDNSSNEKAEKQKEKIKLGWLLLCIAMMIGNSLISIVSKIQQTNTGGGNAFAYMALAYSLTCAVSFLAYMVTQIKSNTLKRDVSIIQENGKGIAVQTVGNTGANLLVSFLSSRVNGAILYPVNMGGGLVLTTVVGFVFFKEKKTWKNVGGILLGIVGLLLLSL